jgi:integrase
MTVSDLFDKCEGTIWHPDNTRAQETVRSNLKFLRARIGEVALEDLTYTRLEAFVSDMKGEGYKPATIKRKLAMVGRALTQATMWTGTDGKPLLAYRPQMPKLVIRNFKERVITAAEEEAIFAAVEKRRQMEPHRQWFQFRVLLTLFFTTAGRLSEVINIGPTNIQEMDGVSYLTFPRYRTKSDKPRTVPLVERAVDAVGSLADHLALDSATGEWRFFGFTDSTADVMFRQVRQDIAAETGMGLSDVTLHTIRHTVLTRLARGGMDLARLQIWAGHSDPKITAERYLHLRPTDLVGGLAILGGTVGTPGAYRERDRISPVSVPNPLSGAIGAVAGTERLQ